MTELSKIVYGVNIGKDCSTSGCSICTQEKQFANPFYVTLKRTTHPLQLVKTDVGLLPQLAGQVNVTMCLLLTIISNKRKIRDTYLKKN